MSRHARIVPAIGVMHVICRGNNRRRLFLYPHDYKVFYLILKRLKREEAVKIYHYVFMPNHIHLLLGLVEGNNIARFMKRLSLKYFYRYQRKYKYTGHLWQGRFKSKLVDKDEYLLQCGKYIELNPVRANLVDAPEDYRFSSYAYYALGRRDEIVDDDPLYAGLSNNSPERRSIYEKMIKCI